MQEVKFMDSLPEVDIPRSQRYVENMASISCQVKSAKRQKSKKKKIIIAIIAAVILLLSACAVSKPIMDFFITVYNDHTRFYSNDGNTDTIEIVYMPSYLPEGYKIQSESIQITTVQVTWVNDKNERILFQQNTTKNNSFTLDTEYSDYTACIIGEQETFYILRYNYYLFVWRDDNYLYQLQCHDSLPREEVEKIILSIQMQPEKAP